MHVTIVSACDVIQNMKQLCLCTSSLSIEHHYMQRQHDAASHSLTHDTHDRMVIKNCIVFYYDYNCYVPLEQATKTCA